MTNNYRCDINTAHKTIYTNRKSESIKLFFGVTEVILQGSLFVFSCFEINTRIPFTVGEIRLLGLLNLLTGNDSLCISIFG